MFLIGLGVILVVVGVVGAFIARADDRETAGIGKLLRLGLVFGVLVLLIGGVGKTFRTVPNGSVGIQLVFGKISGEPLAAGGHFMTNPLTEVVNFSTQVKNTIEKHDAGSQDMQQVHVELAVAYSVLPSDVNWVYQRVGNLEEIHAKIVAPQSQEALKQEISRHQAAEILLKRSVIREAVQAQLKKKLAEWRIVLNEMAIQNISFDEKYQNAIEEKQVKQQLAESKKYELEQAKKEAEILAAKSQGEASSKKILGEAEAAYNQKVARSLTPALVDYYAIQAWDGVQPQIMLGGGGLGSVRPFPQVMLQLPAQMGQRKSPGRGALARKLGEKFKPHDVAQAPQAPATENSEPEQTEQPEAPQEDSTAQ